MQPYHFVVISFPIFCDNENNVVYNITALNVASCCNWLSNIDTNTFFSVAMMQCTIISR